MTTDLVEDFHNNEIALEVKNRLILDSICPKMLSLSIILSAQN